jgi:hypothetical protein
MAKLEDTKRSNAHIEIIAHPEDTHPRDHFDDSLADTVADIIERSEHNVWAWCSVEVNVSYQGLESSAYLGGCSYDSADDFKNTSDGYYNDMLEECIADIAAQMQAIACIVGDDNHWYISLSN